MNKANIVLEEEEYVPENYEEAMKCQNRNEWIVAMNKELEFINEHEVWTLVPREENMKIINSKWVYSMKRKSAGTDQAFNDNLALAIGKFVGLKEKEENEPFIGIEIRRTEHGYDLSQSHYINKILRRFGLEEYNIVQTPGDRYQNFDEYKDSKQVDKTLYQEMIGSLMYLATGTRPDISYNVSNLPQYNNDVREVHLTAVKKIYRKASELKSKKEEEQVNALIYILGEKAEDALISFNLTEIEINNYETVVKKYEEHFIGKRNVIFERAQFNRRYQQDGEAVEEYIRVLHKMAENCNYGSLKEEIIRDRIVVGVKNLQLSEKLQLEPNLERAIQAACQTECVKQQQTILQSTTTQATNVDQVYEKKLPPSRFNSTFGKRDASKKSKFQKWSKPEKSGSIRCGASKFHPYKDCPAKEVKCHKCKKVGHFAKVCYNKTVGQVTQGYDYHFVVEQPTDWCAPMVIVPKPSSNDLRICVDLTALNKFVKREHYPIPSVEYTLAQMGGAKLFSKLDANSGFWQIPLSEESSSLTTFLTPFGRYRFKRLPFGISSAPEVFQRKMSNLLENQSGVNCHMDDIVIWGATQEEHDERLRCVLRKLQDSGLTLNKEKCIFLVKEIKFLGHLITERGVLPDPNKVQAIREFPSPSSISEVRRFLGMEEAFEKVKKLLSTSPALTLFDPNLLTTVSADASSYELGAVLLQKSEDGYQKAVAYASRTMSETEKRWAQIEKEFLAIVWACERFQDYLMGNTFSIETDHKPLIPIFSTKNLDEMTPRIQRLRLRMMRYSYSIHHTPGKDIVVADALSRSPIKISHEKDLENEICSFVQQITSCPPFKNENMKEIWQYQNEERECREIKDYCEKGWPTKNELSAEAKAFWCHRYEMSVIDGLLMRNSRIYIPKSLRSKVLNSLHEGHLGIEKCRGRARSSVWWPRISQEIGELTIILDSQSWHCWRIKQHIQQLCIASQFLLAMEYPKRLDQITDHRLEFKKFAKEYGFHHITSSPRFSQSNGFIESMVKNIKNQLKKGRDPYLSLLGYRTSPLENGYSPAELCMNRKLRTTVPTSPVQLQSRIPDLENLEMREKDQRHKKKTHFDIHHRARELSHLDKGTRGEKIDMEDEEMESPEMSQCFTSTGDNTTCDSEPRTFQRSPEPVKTRSGRVAFDSHFCVRKNIIYERAKFNSRIQEDREPVDEFITSLYKLADSCEFEGLHEQLIRDRIVVGVRDKALSERMQLDSELTLEKAVKMVRQQEAVRQQQVDLQRPSTSQKFNQVKFNSKKQSPKQQQQPSRKKEKSAKTRSRCPKCGGFTHREGQACRAEGQRCNLCSKTGHFANCCPDKQAKTAEVKAVSELDEEIGFLLEVSAAEDSSNLDDDEGECRRRWTAEIQVNGKQVKFKLDSQADVTCVPLCLFKKIMGQQRLVESDINIRAAEFSELQTVGMFISTLRNGNYEIKEKIYVIRRLSEPLLSRRACELLNLARRFEVVATRINPIKEFPEVFEGLGQIGNPYEIKLKPGAKPYAVHTPRRVPIPLMEKLKTRLKELEKAGILAQVNVATEWCAPTVIAGKPNGDIRLCVDLSRLNEHVQREVHPMPVVEHMLGQLGEARLFSKMDANSGFHQIPLSPDCQHLTTFITPFGRYKYCRMPFGISLAPEYFQRVMSIILQGMDGVMCYLDDILIFASDSKTHDRILRLVLRKLKEAKVTLNKAKCVFGVPRINFLGHILDEDGIRPDPAKIEAVAKMPAPTDVHGVRRFLGMVNHLGRFVENLSEIVAPLNQLLVKGQDFVWDCSQERAFRKLKELLTTQPILAAYDVRKPTMVSSDASSYGLGAVLKQEGKNGIWRPVAYSSRTMTPTEKRYAQIEKEAIAITWACERFQDFLLGKRFRIETDHKPLIPLFSTKELSSLTPRLQRFRMRMMRFGFEIVHIPVKELLDADALSRQPLLTTEGGEDERPTSAHINAVLSSITDKDEMLTKIFEAQQEDTTLKAVVNYLEQGWPDKKKMSQALLSYWHVKDELGVQNGLLMRSCRLVIPASMKLEILDKLHAGHFGITKTRLRARETVWWPGISEEIAETVRKCSVCIQEAVSKHEPLIPTNFPTRPWQKIGMDLFKFENKWYLVVIDYYSRFPEVVQLDRLTANVVVRSCKSIFARHGIPETVVSDNGTQFGAAREFANFARQYGFTHVTSSPRFPQSNGMAEAGVKIGKLILKKNQDPSLGLLEYRSTPLENGYSPAELLMGRKLRTTLPIAPENLNPKLVDSQTLKRKEGRRRKDMKSRYDRRCGATDMEELSEGDTVWITDMRTCGIVKQKASTPRSYIVDTPVATLRRNRFHLRKGVTVQYPAVPSTPTFSGEDLVENEKTP
ncbi:K02A2.6-like, partial [Cordylochernes scorpioides]